MAGRDSREGFGEGGRDGEEVFEGRKGEVPSTKGVESFRFLEDGLFEEGSGGGAGDGVGGREDRDDLVGVGESVEELFESKVSLASIEEGEVEGGRRRVLVDALGVE